MMENNKELYVRSPLNHLGNKYRIINRLNDVFDIFDEQYVFVDVFGGSGVVGVNSKFDSIIYNEYDEYLFEINKVLFFNDPSEILKKLNRIIRRYDLNSEVEDYKENKDNYLRLRNNFNRATDFDVFKLITLVLFGFNSQIRFNSKGEFNIPLGKSGLNLTRSNNLLKFNKSAMSKHIEMYNLDFEVFVRKIIKKFDNKKILFYFDPPYLISNATYNSNWDRNSEERLINVLKLLNSEGYPFVLSNFLTNGDMVNDQLASFVDFECLTVSNIEINYNGANYQRKSKSVEEVIVTNFEVIPWRED